MLYHDIDINHSIHIDIPVESYNKSIQFNTSVSSGFNGVSCTCCSYWFVTWPGSWSRSPKGPYLQRCMQESVFPNLLQHAPHFPWASNTHHGFRRAPWPLICWYPKKLKIFQRWLRTKNLPVRKLKSGHGHKLNFVDGSLQFQVNSHHDLKHDGLAPSNAEHRHPTSDRVVWCFLAQCCTG